MNRTIIVESDSSELTTRVIEALNEFDPAVIEGLRSPPYVPFETRDEAEAATVPAEVQYIRVDGLDFYRDPAGDALTTADGAKWSPQNAVRLEHYGADRTGVADATAAVSLAAASGNKIETVGGVFSTTLGLAALPKAVDGDATITYAGGTLPRRFRYVDEPPTSVGNPSGFNTAFNGDWSKTFPPSGVYLTGAATLGQPVTGFEHNENLSPDFMFMRNLDSGHNEALDGNVGRTTWIGKIIKGLHSGQGGMMGVNVNIFVNGATRPGVTSFLANPAAACCNLEAHAGAPGVYLNPLELNCEDNGHDVAAIGPVINMRRTNKTGALQAFWSGCRIQSTGAEAINSGYQVSGKADTGLDFTKANFASGGQAAIALSADQRIYLNAASANAWHKTVNNGNWIAYNSTNAALEVFAGGTEKIRLTAASMLVRNGSLNIETGNVSILSPSGVIAVNGQAVVGSRKPGWTAATGTKSRATFVTDSVTLPQLAARLGTLIDDLIAHGLIGA